MQTWFKWMLALSVTSLMTACGGDDDPPPPTPTIAEVAQQQGFTRQFGRPVPVTRKKRK